MTKLEAEEVLTKAGYCIKHKAPKTFTGECQYCKAEKQLMRMQTVSEAMKTLQW